MEIVLVIVAVALLVGAVLGLRAQRARRRAAELADARAEARRWYERLGGQVMNLGGDAPAVRQALVDAGERYNAAGSQLEQARTVRQCQLARETALEGLAYIRAARSALGLEPGPDFPAPAAAQGAGQLTRERSVDVQGQVFKAGPRPDQDTPYYHPGGRYQGRPVPAGWYSTPWWKTALGAGAGVLIANALFSPAFADPGYAYGAGYEEGFSDAGDQGDPGGDGGGDLGGGEGFGGGDFGGFGGDVGGGDFGGFGGD